MAKIAILLSDEAPLLGSRLIGPSSIARRREPRPAPIDTDREIPVGEIHQDVRNGHLKTFPHEETLLAPFLSGFDVNWARRRVAYNTELSMYFLGPESFMSQMFGFEHEIALFISNYSTIESRGMQAIDKLLSDEPARGRVEQSMFLLCSPAGNGRAWVKDYTSRNPQSRMPVVFHSPEFSRVGSDAWYIRNVLRDQLFSRDLFDYQLPLNSDLYFFGRDQIVADHLDAIKRSQNRGLFGLRKTGKTSILYKVQRLVEREKIGAFLYYDCKSPSIRMLRWDEFLKRIVADIAKAHDLPKPRLSGDPRKATDALNRVLQLTSPEKVTALVFDEIEYISPLAIEDKHWHVDFVPFWQSLWTAQSQVRRLSNTIVGVNATIAEQDTVNGVQNPMFGIVQPRYLQGLAESELRGMVRTFGKRMGLSFSLDATEYLLSRYGGHPLLTRMACSEVHETLDREKKQRPVELTKSYLQSTEVVRDAELTFYCRHVVSELSRFYSDEYELLEMLAAGGDVDVMDYSIDPEYVRHLKEYGLLTVNEVGRPLFAIPVVGQYIGNELARKEKRRLVRRVIPLADRLAWVRRRSHAILRDVRELCRLSSRASAPAPYSQGGFPEPERFVAFSAVSSSDEFVAFINVCNRCMVESVEQIGRSLGRKDYFWDEIKLAYPDLWSALHRIKVYRNNDLHLELKSHVETALRDFLDADLEGRRVSQVEDVWFVLQQCVLDSILLGVQCELNRYS